MAEELRARIEPTLAAQSERPRWLVGFSGGLDSTALLDLLRRFLSRRRQAGLTVPDLLAIHVHHGLYRSADVWQQHCRQFCQQWHIPFESVAVTITDQRRGLEAAARDARYGAIAQLQRPGDVLFLGHHLNDQLETVLLRLFRSSGIAGLAGMAEQSHQQPLRLRPLLNTTRAELHRYALGHDLAWIEDDSNTDTRFSRNFIRHRLLPVIAEHWPDYQSRLMALSRSARDSKELLDELAGEDLAAVASRDRWGSFLDMAPLASLSRLRIKNMARAWLHQLGQADLRQRQWPAFFEDLMAAAGDATPVLALPKGSLRRYRRRLYWVPAELDQMPLDIPAWDCRQVLELGAVGQLRASAASAGGLDDRRSYQLAFCRGGEKVRGVGWSCSKSLKQYLHEQAVPPWWRQRVPLLYCEGQLAAVADLCVCEGFAPAPGDTGLRLEWRAGSSAPVSGNLVEPPGAFC